MGIGEFFTPAFQFRGGKGKVKRGDLSVAMSHLLAWRSVAQGNHCLHPPSRSSDDCWVLILEDDVKLNIPDTCLLRGGGQTRIKLDPLPPDADMVLLFPSRLIKQDCSSHPSCEMFSEVSDGSGLIGYVVSRRSAKKLVRVFEQVKLRMPIDLQIYKLPGISVFASKADWILHQDNIPSDRIAQNGLAE
ncbi:hypothetical protein GUITHDRAFT_108966 [Guillardia theta CCMP2712]|uniref:Uncharacterized protein n=2 Tax=Guillardia theta TaxID=55529 RepID=L1J9W8_GUITC|nr:hypothetical protein GUITHDRAFT_108966 [Guillardia theta CCMP2712]EKX45328.1 hypothetical protein GUITHDRAFT_108966 [Guillardia theta CCMP2712]|eukprot:XP_005832308.1 hypothetical protein GUITHDRAFT_108966 [Guillardia theta CCMP2712]